MLLSLREILSKLMRGGLPMAFGVLLAGSAIAQDVPPPDGGKVPPPIPTPNDPTKGTVNPKAKSIIEDLADQAGQKPAVPPAGVVRPDPGLVGDATKEAQNVADRQRQGLLAYQQALAAQQANRPVEALNLARKAKQLFPNNPEISELAAKLQKEVGANRMFTATNTKAKAYLAAGYARGHDLLLAGRYAEAEDMLLGVLEAAKLFSDQTQIEFYKKLADADLSKYRAAVAAGAIIPDTATNGTTTDTSRQANVGQEPPQNARRILSDTDSRSPQWYIQHKNLLAAPMTVDYRRVPAAMVFDEIAQRTNVSIVIDRPVALARSHINALVDFRIGDVPAETVLDFTCRKAGLEYVIMEKAVVITTRSKALEYLRQMPDSLRNNWAVGRVLFPEVNPDLFASSDNANAGASLSPQRIRFLDANVPAHLQSGKALVAAVQALLK